MIPCKYEDVTSFSEGLAAVAIKINKQLKVDFVNKHGEMVIPCKYDYTRNFSEGLAAVEKNGKWGFIDKAGNEVIPCQYYHVESFENGLAYVVNNFGEYFYIDKKGNRVEPCFEYSNIINSDIINYDKVVTEELYISNEEEIPDDCLSIEILAYNSLLVLNNGDRVEIEEPTREKWKKEVAKIIEHELSSLENNINSTFARKRSIK